MDQLSDRRRERIEGYLLERNVGYEVLDAMVQANIKIDSMTVEMLERIVAQFAPSP